MFRFSIISILLILLTSIACTKTESTKSIEEINLSGTPVKIPSDYLGGFKLLLSNDSLFTLCSYTDSIFELALVKDNNLIQVSRFGKKGNGPLELTKGAIIKNINGNFLIVDNSTGFISKIYEVTPRNLQESSAWTEFKIESTRYLPNGSAVAVNDSCILMISGQLDNPSTILSKINYHKDIITPISYWPEDGYTGPSIPKFMVYMENAKLFKGPDNKYLYQCGNGLFAEIFTIENNEAISLSKLYNEYPKYSAAADGLNYTMQSGGHSIVTSANDKYIYIFHYNKKEDGSISDKARQTRYGDEIDVFDWNGQHVKKIHLDHGGAIIDVDENDSKLYLAFSDPITGEVGWFTYNLK